MLVIDVNLTLGDPITTEILGVFPASVGKGIRQNAVLIAFGQKVQKMQPSQGPLGSWKAIQFRHLRHLVQQGYSFLLLAGDIGSVLHSLGSYSVQFSINLPSAIKFPYGFKSLQVCRQTSIVQLSVQCSIPGTVEVMCFFFLPTPALPRAYPAERPTKKLESILVYLTSSVKALRANYFSR